MMRLVRTVAVVAAAAVAVMACGGDDTDESVDVFGPYLGDEADAFAASMIGHELDTGVRVFYTGSGDFESDLQARLDEGLDPPDVAIVPQPALIVDLIESGRLTPFDDDTVTAIVENYPYTEEELTTGDGVYFLPYRASVKSIVWYRPDVFDEHGWSVPGTLDGLTELVDEIEAGGEMAPWCFGIFSGSATGWPATDWVEDLVLRRAGPDVYDQWTRGEIPFADERIRAAFDELSALVLEPGRAAGGVRAIVQTEVEEVGDGLFADPPECAMYKQASFADAWFPDDVDTGTDGDVDFFVLPGEGDGDPPLVSAGDGLVQFSDRPEVHELMAYLATPAGSAAWAEVGGYVSQRDSLDPATYYSGVDSRFARLLLDADLTRFDGSDVMPPPIGADLLWSQITQWIAGAITLDELVEAVDSEFERVGDDEVADGAEVADAVDEGD
jgi:alpha-glucoside transport system substrate-binding protein